LTEQLLIDRTCSQEPFSESLRDDQLWSIYTAGHGSATINIVDIANKQSKYESSKLVSFGLPKRLKIHCTGLLLIFVLESSF